MDKLEFQITNPDQAVMFEQINIIYKFALSVLDDTKDLDLEFSKAVDKHFWDLI